MASGDVPFSENLRKYFDASIGAYSPVTNTEVGDGQLTVSGAEKELVIGHFGATELAQYQGNDATLEAAGLDARREFRLFPTGRIVRPKLKYPKPGNSELRLYFNSEEFTVRKDRVWGTFLRGSEIWIYQLPRLVHDDIVNGAVSGSDRNEVIEAETDDYQEIVNSAAPEQIASTSMSWKRNPRIAAQSLLNHGYICELFPEHPVFVSRFTGKPFVEAHHLIPMKEQAKFEMNLDVAENICVLSPFGHRKIHVARFDDIVSDLNRLIASRAGLLEHARITADELLGLYRS